MNETVMLADVLEGSSTISVISRWIGSDLNLETFPGPSAGASDGGATWSLEHEMAARPAV